MEAQIEIMTLGQLKQRLAELEKTSEITDETKIFLDTGWDSIQEISPDALAVEDAQRFAVEDEFTKEKFIGYALEEKAEKMNAEEKKEKVIVIKNLYQERSRMNKKRWIAVLIAAGLLVISLVSSSLTTKEKEETQMTGLNSLLYGSDELTPTIHDVYQ